MDGHQAGPIRVSWQQIAGSQLPRSSHTIAVSDSSLLLFGGEIQPRQPVPNDLHVIDLEPPHNAHSTNSSSAPSARVGAASTTCSGKSYIFSGRGGPSMAAIEEKGALHVLDLASFEWGLLTPADENASYPPARSYHAMASNGKDTIYVHAGCPAAGRLSDLWSFHIPSRQWKQLKEAPGPHRGGTSLAFGEHQGQESLFRMHGFDGFDEQGYALDVYSFDIGEWRTVSWKSEEGPSARSVSCLLSVRVHEKQMLFAAFGESDPSNLGHQGAGRMLGDAWVMHLEQDSTVWQRVEYEGAGPKARGWFAADVKDGKEVVVHGGLSEGNERLGDAWVLKFD